MIENDDEIRGFGSSMTIKPWHSSFEVVAIDKKAMVSLINYRISATMWWNISIMYEQSVKEKKHVLQQHFFSLTMGLDQDMSSFISKVEALVVQLNDMRGDHSACHHH